MLDALPADLHRAEDGLEGEGGGAATGDALPPFAVALSQDQLAVGAFDRLLEQAAFEDLATAFEDRFEELGELVVWLGHGQFERELRLKDHAIVLDLDVFESDSSLKFLRGTPGDVLH